MTCSKCPFETGNFIDLVKHYRVTHGMSLNDAMAEANRRKPMKSMAEAVDEHNLFYGIEA